MDCSKNTKKQKSQGCLTLKCSVIISYLVSLMSNVLLIVIQFLSGHGYKWIGLLLHGFSLLCILLSLKNLFNFNNKNLLRYKSMSKYYAFSLVFVILFYIILIIYMIVTNTDMDLIYYFIFCVLIWVVFHLLFLSIIKSFIKVLEDRPAQKGSNARMIDKNLRDLMLSNQTGNI